MALVLALGIAACGGAGPGPPPQPAPSAEGGRAPQAARPALCGRLRVTITGRVEDRGLTELSGLATSLADPGRLWAIEDSGSPATLIGLRADGTVETRAAVTGAANVDWEDVAALPGELVIADVGDNATARDGVQLHRVPEPAPGATATAPATRLDLRYPDGAHDAEAVLADPRSGDLLVVTKALGGGRVYAVPRRLARSTASGAGASAAGTLRRGPAVQLALVTGGAVSGDGRIVVLRTYTGMAVWRRRGDERLTRTLRRPYDCIARPTLLREGQGEAIALDRRGRTARTVPEAPNAPLRRYAPATTG